MPNLNKKHIFQIEKKNALASKTIREFSDKSDKNKNEPKAKLKSKKNIGNKTK